jgi:TolA-binding protein
MTFQGKSVDENERTSDRKGFCMKKGIALWSAGGALLLGMSLSGCVAPSDVSDLRAQLDTVSTRVSKLEGKSGGEQGSGGSQLADMESRLDNQKLRLARLRDRVSKMNHRLDELMNQIETQNAMFRSMGPASVPSPATSPPASPPVHAAPSASAVPAPMVAETPSKPQGTPDTLYRQAMSDYQQGHYDIAVKEFKSVVDLFPDSHLASSAVFWEAQSHFNMKQYRRALTLYDDVIHKYADSPKKATAYFKKGQIYEKLNDRKQAIHNYRRVLELFPLEQQLDDLAKRRLSRLDE